MTDNQKDSPIEQTREWVKEVSSLQSRLSEKLQAIGFYRPDQDDGISHHLAEVSFTGSVIAERLVPGFFERKALNFRICPLISSKTFEK